MIFVVEKRFALGWTGSQIGLIEKLLNDNNVKYEYLDTIAAHDAVPLSKIVPSTVFVTPSVDGIIHDPKEFTKPEDLEVCLDILYQYISQECLDDRS